MTENLDFIVMTTAFGGRDISELEKTIPNLKICKDYMHDAMGNFLNSLNYTENPCVHMEDDVELCDNFMERITEAISMHPDCVINFFSMRKKDYELKRPYFETGAKYLANVCFYLPEGMGPKIASYYDEWEGKQQDPTGLDTLIAAYLKKNKLRYVQWFPHLVNHKVGKSLINPKRSSQRIDKNFTK